MALRVLVLGADGFIGRHLLQALETSAWAQPVAAGRRDVSEPNRSSARLRLDATDAGALSAALRDIDAVVNCVAGTADTIVRGAEALAAAAAAQAKPPRVVHISSIAVYGPATGVVAETAPLVSQEPYGRAKIRAEAVFSGYDSGVVVRPGIVYGPGSRQWTDRIARWLWKRRLGDLGAAGDGICNLVFIDDVVAALCNSLRRSDVTGQAFNLAMRDPPTWNQYLVDFARAIGAVPVARISPRRLRLESKALAPPLKILEILCRRAGLSWRALPEPIPPSLTRLFRQEICLDSTRAERCLELQWTTLADGLRQSARSLDATQ
jgi:nucleoside-diphosphate-sugar epimerase